MVASWSFTQAHRRAVVPSLFIPSSETLHRAGSPMSSARLPNGMHPDCACPCHTVPHISSRLHRAVCPFWRAREMAVPKLHSTFLSAPALIRSWAQDKWPLFAASINAVTPAFMVAFTAAPASISARVTSSCPFCAARMRGVEPLGRVLSISAPASISARAHCS